MYFKYRLCIRKCFNEYDVIAVMLDSIPFEDGAQTASFKGPVRTAL
jgi:hypothetical protein